VPQVRPRTEERRGWLAHGLAALAISAVGIAVGAAPLSSSAQAPLSAVEAQRRAGLPVAQLVPGTVALEPQTPSASQPAATLTGALGAFLPPPAAADPVDEAVRVAVVKERAAQRAEDLSKQAEDATRLTRTAAKEARTKDLASTDRKIRETAVRIAAERRQRALAVRIAAEVARRRAEATAASTGPTTGTAPTTVAPTTVDTSALPAGTVGSEPVPGAVVGASFGATGLWARYHTGLDFRAAQGTPIRAVQAGIVLFAGNSGNWAGNHVAIMHADGVTTMSSHLSSMAVRAGEQVTAGQVIGRVGQTGRAFGAHLHFEVYPRGVKYGDLYSAVNPLPWLQAQGVRTR
jgi:murein DD-endopeptidase MepM/ murein hydrolase activator NlpD